MKAATLFSGIGAPEQAMLDWDWLWHAEIEKFPAAVMAQRHPGSVNLGDVNAEDFVERALKIGCPDVLVFGSPCQDFSVAGKRVGLDGARGNMALVALGIAADGPRYKALGNSMCVADVRWILTRLEAVDSFLLSHQPQEF